MPPRIMLICSPHFFAHCSDERKTAIIFFAGGMISCAGVLAAYWAIQNKLGEKRRGGPPGNLSKGNSSYLAGCKPPSVVVPKRTLTRKISESR